MILHFSSQSISLSLTNDILTPTTPKQRRCWMTIYRCARSLDTSWRVWMKWPRIFQRSKSEKVIKWNDNERERRWYSAKRFVENKDDTEGGACRMHLTYTIKTLSMNELLQSWGKMCVITSTLHFFNYYPIRVFVQYLNRYDDDDSTPSDSMPTMEKSWMAPRESMLT